jgi:hypothetical protein
MDPTFSRQSARNWLWGYQTYATAALYRKGRFVVFISFRGWVRRRDVVRLERSGKLKNIYAGNISLKILKTDRCVNTWLPLWCSGQSSWLQIQRSGFDSRRYHIFWEVVGLERGPLSLLSTIEGLLGRKSSGSGLEIENTAVQIRHADDVPPSIPKSWH